MTTTKETRTEVARQLRREANQYRRLAARRYIARHQADAYKALADNLDSRAARIEKRIAGSDAA